MLEMLTQNATLHTGIIQQLGPWPLPHCLGQGRREDILISNFSSNAQGLSQPEGRSLREEGVDPRDRGSPSASPGSPTCG